MSWGRRILAFIAGMLVIGIFTFTRLGLPDMTPTFENPRPLLIFMLLLLGLFVIGILFSFLSIVLDYRMARILSLLDRLWNKPWLRGREINRLRRKD